MKTVNYSIRVQNTSGFPSNAISITLHINSGAPITFTANQIVPYVATSEDDIFLISYTATYNGQPVSCQGTDTDYSGGPVRSKLIVIKLELNASGNGLKPGITVWPD